MNLIEAILSFRGKNAAGAGVLDGIGWLAFEDRAIGVDIVTRLASPCWLSLGKEVILSTEHKQRAK